MNQTEININHKNPTCRGISTRIVPGYFNQGRRVALPAWDLPGSSSWDALASPLV